MPEKITIPEVNPKNIILLNQKMPGVIRRARKSELAWYAQRGWVPVEPPQVGQGVPAAPSSKP